MHTACIQKLCLQTSHQDACKAMMSQLYSHHPQQRCQHNCGYKKHWKHWCGRCLLRLVRVDQSEETGLFKRWPLMRHTLIQRVHSESRMRYFLVYIHYQHNMGPLTTEKSQAYFIELNTFLCRLTSQTALRWRWEEMRCLRTHTDASCQLRGLTCWRHDCGWSLREKKDWIMVVWQGSGSSSCLRRCSTRTMAFLNILPRESLFIPSYLSYTSLKCV